MIVGTGHGMGLHGYTIAFDLDGTLVDTAPDLIDAANHVMALLGLPLIADADLRPSISFGARAMIVKALELNARPLGEAEVDRHLESFLRYYAANIARRSRPFEGAVGAIMALRMRGARIAVCTNKREALSRQLLSELGLLDLIDGLAGRDTFAVCKPHPDHLTGAIGLAGGEPSRALMIGDSDVDVATARAAGVPVIGVSFGYTHAPVATFGPDAVIDHYAELEAAARRVLALT
jgi:phosphoglycolate phosphatase